jgi:WD40 repeat protein
LLIGTPLRAWLIAFAAFELMLYVGMTTHQEGGVAASGAVGFLVAVAILVGRPRTSRADAEQAPRERPPSRRMDWAATVAIVLVGVAASLAVFMASLPIAVTADPQVYIGLSEGILGRSVLSLGHLTYPYPLVIAATRLLWDSVLSIVLLQHALRIGAAVAAYYALRSTSTTLALVAGLLLAVDPIMAYYAHSVLTESLYATCLLGMVLLTYRLATRSSRRWPLAVGLGALAAWTSLLRPAGMLLIVPLLLYVLIGSRSWRRTALTAGGFAVAALLLAFGQWRITGQFGFGTQSDVYYVFPYFHYGLFDPNNGPAAGEAYSYLPRADCDFALPENAGMLGSVSFPQNLTYCAANVSAALATPPLSVMALYREGIVAQPARFVTGFLAESAHFVTHSDWVRATTATYVPLPLTYYTALSRGQCLAMLSTPQIQAYGCPSLALPRLSLVVESMPRWLLDFLNLVQPYRLAGQGFWERAWTALLLLAFVLVEGTHRFRALAGLCLVMIAYQAAVTAFGQWNLPRYAAVVVPEFVLLTSLILTLLGTEVIRAARGAWMTRQEPRSARLAPWLSGSLAILLALAGIGLSLANRDQAQALAAEQLATASARTSPGSDPTLRPGERTAAAAPLLGDGLIADLAWHRDGPTGLELRDGAVWLQDESGRRLLDGLAPPVGGLVVDRAAGRVAASGSDGRVRLWSLRDSAPGKALAEQAAPAHSLAFGASGHLTLAGEEQGQLQVWDLEAGSGPLLLHADQGTLTYVVASPDGALAVGADGQGKTCLWDLSTGALRGCTTKPQGPVVSVGFSPDGALWATGSLDGALRVYDTATATERNYRYTPSPHVYDVAFSPDGKQVTAANAAGKAAVWGVGPPGAVLAHAGWQAMVGQWETTSGQRYRAARPHALWSVAWSSLGTLAVGAADGTIWTWDPDRTEGPRSLTGHQGAVLDLAFDPAGRLIASGGADRTVRLWDPAGGEDNEALTGAGRAIYAVSAPDAEHVSARSWDGATREWIVGAPDSRALPDRRPPVRAQAESVDGRWRAVASKDERVLLEDGRGGLIAALPGHAGGVSALAFSPDGRWLATGGRDARVRVWDVSRRSPVAELVGHRDDVTGLAFRPDGQVLASVGWDGSLRLWALPAAPPG